MNKVALMPVVAAVLFAAACKDATTTVDTRAQVRFLNATTGMMGKGAFTTNGRFAAGSALAVGQWTQACARVDAGSTTFGFGPANAGRLGASANVLATLNGQSITDGGDFIVAATGSATTPQLFLLDNTFPGQLGTGEAGVRFVNLAPGADAANTYVVFQGPVGAGALLAAQIAPGAPTTFSAVASGSNEFSILKLPGHVVAVEGSAGTLELQDGSINTLAIVQNASGGFQLINLERCS